MWDRWNYHPERLREAETRLDALDTWEQWAHGHRVERDQLSDSVEALTHSPEAATDGALALAHVVRQWANQNHVDIQPRRTQNLEQSDLGIEIDF
jgi:hypothetical protein